MAGIDARQVTALIEVLEQHAASAQSEFSTEVPDGRTATDTAFRVQHRECYRRSRFTGPLCALRRCAHGDCHVSDSTLLVRCWSRHSVVSRESETWQSDRKSTRLNSSH